MCCSSLAGSGSTLVACAATEAEHVLRDELTALADAHPGVITYLPVSTRDRGSRVTAQELAALLPSRDATIFLCGPSPMVRGVAKMLREDVHIPSDTRIIYEDWGDHDTEIAL
jgi:ferredoxin-NADP reductase